MSLAITPSAPSAYKRFMGRLFDEQDYVGVPTGFQSLFGRPEFGGETEYENDDILIDVDIIRANERLGQMVPRGMYADPIDPHAQGMIEKFTTRSFVFPLGREQGTVHASELKRRSAGETPYERRSGRDRARMKGFRQHKSHIRKFGRLFEYLAAESILTGKMPALVGTTDAAYLYDFKRKSTHAFTAGASWLLAATDIKANIDTAINLIRKDAKVKADVMICGDSALKGLILNTQLKAEADNRSFDTFFIAMDKVRNPRFDFLSEAGMDWRGRIQTTTGAKLDIFTYNEWYTNAAGTQVKYIADDECLILATEAKRDKFFGPNERLDYSPQEIAEMQFYLGMSPTAIQMPDKVKGGNLDPRMFHFDAYVSPQRDGICFRTMVAPIFAPTMVDATVKIDVVP